MATLDIPNTTDDFSEGYLQIATGEDIDFDSSQEDAVIEFAEFHEDGSYKPMNPFGFTLNAEEAEQLFQMLGRTLGHFE